MQNLISWLEGKKTYIVSLLTVAYGVYQSYIATGAHGWKSFVSWLLAGAGLAALRAAISKVLLTLKTK